MIAKQPCKRCKQLFEPRGTYCQFDYYFCEECVEHAISDWNEMVEICSQFEGDED